MRGEQIREWREAQPACDDSGCRTPWSPGSGLPGMQVEFAAQQTVSGAANGNSDGVTRRATGAEGSNTSGAASASRDMSPGWLNLTSKVMLGSKKRE